MAYFAHLPHLILRRILFKPYSGIYHDANYLKNGLAYGQVCKSWRYAALPTLYARMFYTLNSDRKDCQLESNYGLIMEFSLSRYVKKVSISLQGIKDIALFLRNFRQIFGPGNSVWRNVTSLRLISKYLLPISETYSLDGEYIDIHSGFVDFAEFIHGNMPLITELFLNYIDVSETSEILTTKLFDAYHRQLVGLTGGYVSSFEKYELFENLTCLDIAVNLDYDQPFPRFDIGKLKRLYLRDIPYAFSWEVLLGKIDEKEVKFGSLNEMNLLFSTNYTEEEYEDYLVSIEHVLRDFSLVVHFPKLASLHMSNRPCILLRQCKYKFSSMLNTISIYNSTTAVQMLENVNPVDIDFFFFWISSKTEGIRDQFYEQTNRIFGATSKDAKKNDKIIFEVTIRSLAYSINWSMVRWPALCAIVLGECNVYTFFSLLKSCPSLREIQIDKFDVEQPLDIIHNIFNNQEKEHFDMDVVNKNVRLLSIFNISSKGACTRSEIASFMRNIVLFFRSLETLVVRDGQWLNLERCVESLSLYYEHLASLKLKYKHY